MSNEEQKRRNKNNRKRGGQFEKNVGDFLDMDVVPYSGSNDRFGYGDIRDSIWLGECKNITPEDGVVTIDHKWLKKNADRAKAVGKIPFLAWMAYGSAEKYVILDWEAFEYLMEPISNHDLAPAIRKSCEVIYVLPKKVHNTVNFKILVDSEMLRRLRPKCNVSRFCLDCGQPWYIMHLGHFKMMLDISGLKGQRSIV